MRVIVTYTLFLFACAIACCHSLRAGEAVYRLPDCETARSLLSAAAPIHLPHVGDVHQASNPLSLGLESENEFEVGGGQFGGAPQVAPTTAGIYCWQTFPDGLMYRSYIAGEKEPRMGVAWLNEDTFGPLVEAALGGRVGLVRYGSCGSVDPQGWQLDLEGAALPRLDSSNSELVAVDFRFGLILTHRCGPTAWKGGYYHLSSHLGDEWLLDNLGFVRNNYVRDAILLGCHHRINQDLAVYGEIAYSPTPGGGAEPLEFQFGAEFSPARRRAPFAAVNVHLREEFDFGGSVNATAGWQWRGMQSDRVFRVGGQIYEGYSMQYSFFNQRELMVGIGMWFEY